ncbi:MAG: hypothetical protein ABH952_07075 [Candidatus Omnitrophota bacterium]
MIKNRCRQKAMVLMLGIVIAGLLLPQAMALLEEDVTVDIPILVLKYFPTIDGVNLDSGVTGVTATLAGIRTRVDKLTNEAITALNKGSTYHGYKDSSAMASLNYFVADSREFLYAIPKSVQFPPFPDHMQILTDLNIADYVDNQGIKEVWIWMYHTADIVPIESNMAIGNISGDFWNYGSYGDVSNSYRQNDLPICNKTYTVYDYNYGRGLGEAVEDHTHQLEAVFRWVDNDLFWNKFVNPYGRTDIVNHCGWTHCPPNTISDYDWYNETIVSSNCEDWHPDGSGEIKLVNCHTWEEAWPGDTGGGEAFKVWWMQNIPGKNNDLYYEGNKLKNWWDFIGDFDQALQFGRSLTINIPSDMPLEYCSYSTDGVSEGGVSAGSEVRLIVMLKNGCSTQLVDVCATISTEDPRVIITDSLAVFGNISGGAKKDNLADPFSFSVAADYPVGGYISFNLTINCYNPYGEVYSDTVSFEVSTIRQKRITSNVNDQLFPDIWGDRIVWSDSRNGNYDIYLYDLQDEQEKQISGDSFHQLYSVIWQDLIVCMNMISWGEFYLNLYDLKNPHERRILWEDAWLSAPDICNNKITWADNRNGNFDIYRYDIQTEQEIQVTDYPSYQSCPRTDNNRICWEDNRNGNFDIYLYNLETGAEIQITTDPADQR